MMSMPPPRAGGNRFALALILALAAGALSVRDAAGQNRLSSGLPNPRVLVVSPAGGKVGTSVESSAPL